MLPPLFSEVVENTPALAEDEIKEAVLLRLIARISCCFSVVLLASVAPAQTEFSADVVNFQRGPQTQAKIYLAKDKIRIESLEQKTSRGTGVFLMNLDTQTAMVLIPQQHMYMEMPASTMGERGVYSFFRTGDVENACADWLKLHTNQGGTCHKVGSETVNGRSTVKYEGTNAKGDAGQVWLDPKIRFPVKWQDKNGGGELRDIQEGTQPAVLFEIPAGYTKMDLGGMMQQRMNQPH